MKINNLSYLIKEGFRSIFLHGFASFAAVCVTVACLLIMGIFTSLVYNVDLMVDELNQTNEVLVYVDESLSYAEARSVETEIRALDNVMHANFKSREEALEDFIADHEGDPAFSGVEADTLRHRVIVVLEDNAQMKATIEQIRTVSGVADITAYYELAEGFTTLENVLSVVSASVIIVLLVVSLLIISNTIKIGMFDRRDEIAIMKMVGATNGFIRLPFVVEGFVLGMTGAGLAFVLNLLMYNYMEGRLEALDTLNIITLVPFSQLLLPMVITFVAAGLFVGVVGSWTSIRKFLNV